jgi:hypothetical protein
MLSAAFASGLVMSNVRAIATPLPQRGLLASSALLPQQQLLVPMRHHTIGASRSPQPIMQDVPFWENVVRFMRFGVTATTGLIAGLLSPFAAFMRTPTLQAIGASIFVGILAFTYLTLTAMNTTPEYVPPPPSAGYQQRAAPADPSMKSMMSEIYGDFDGSK